MSKLVKSSRICKQWRKDLVVSWKTAIFAPSFLFNTKINYYEGHGDFKGFRFWEKA